MFGGTFWDEHYRSRRAVWSGEPNPQLVDEVSGLTPGTALDVGCGEGADAIWLAQRGWRVTAADISSVALERAQAIEVSLDVASRIEWLHIDLVAAAPPGAPYDLVSAHFMQLPPAPRESLFRRLATAVKPEGSLLVVGHHPSDLQTTAKRPPLPELFYTAAEVAALLEPSDWEIIVQASRERSTTDPAGRTITIHDTVLRARRCPDAS
jgi:SAM-dependent methyltransferase